MLKKLYEPFNIAKKQVYIAKQGKRGIANFETERRKKQSFHDIAVEKSNVGNLTYVLAVEIESGH